MNPFLELKQLKTQIVRERAKRKEEYDRAHPEVGFPPVWGMHVLDAMKELEYSREDVYFDQLIPRGNWGNLAPRSSIQKSYAGEGDNYVD